MCCVPSHLTQEDPAVAPRDLCPPTCFDQNNFCAATDQPEVVHLQQVHTLHTMPCGRIFVLGSSPLHSQIQNESRIVSLPSLTNFFKKIYFYLYCSWLQTYQMRASDLITDCYEPPCSLWEIELRTSGRAVSALNHLTISPAQLILKSAHCQV